MKQEELIKYLKENFEEISFNKWANNYTIKSFNIQFPNQDTRYFKEKQTFPIVFEDDSIKIEITEEKVLFITDLNKNVMVCFDRSLPLLKEAMKILEDLE